MTRTTSPAVSLPVALSALAGAALLACRGALLSCSGGLDGEPENEPRPGPPGAHWEVVEDLRAAQNLEHDPADGGGRAWLEQAEGDPTVAVVGTPGRFTIVYEVGPLGIAQGGGIHFLVSPFWGWSTPQVELEDAPGYTTVETEGPYARFEAGTADESLLLIQSAERALEPGERIRIVYGAGPAGATADQHAEHNSRFWIGIDGDGDGTRRILADSPGIDVRAGPAAQLLLTGPTTARPGEPIRLAVAFLDLLGNAGTEIETELTLEVPTGLELPEQVVFTAEHAGTRVIEGVAREPGTYRIRGHTPDGFEAESNPLRVDAAGPRILWGDLHGHTAFTDGTGLPDAYFEYARDIANLDVVALTDHDHWGVQPLDEHPELVEEIAAQTRRFHEPGRFVTLHGYEWTNWIHGHRHVLYFEDGGPLLSSLDLEYDTPQKLWQALKGRLALTLAHHSAGGPVPTNWDIPPDPVFEPVTEIVSVHGSSEALDSPLPIYSAVPGNFVRDVLDRGYRLGFVGSGDTHDGHPGLGQLAAAPLAGLAAILSEDRTRAGVLEALRARRVYATSGPRILLRMAFGTHRMGETVTVPDRAYMSDQLFVHVIAPGPLARIDLIRSGEVVDSIATEGRREVQLLREVEHLDVGEYLYVRAVQEDDQAAWSSPIFFE